MFRIPLITLLSLLLIGCGQLISLHSDLETVDSMYEELHISVPEAQKNQRHVIVQLSSLDKQNVIMVNSIEKVDQASLPSFFDLTDLIFVFQDKNLDFTYQLDEPSYLFSKDSLNDNKAQIDPSLHIRAGIPELQGLSVIPYLELQVKQERIGQVVQLTDPTFSEQAREMGMWQPIKFIEQEYAGIFFLEEYSPDKIPVLFIHGMGGSAQDFAEMIHHLDRDKYQPWLVNYPSALSLTLLSHSVAGMMKQLKQQYDFDAIHIVAHSMGGVLTQRYLNVCSVGNRCDSIQSFTSIASPFGGVPSAESGVKYSPVAMPSWTGLMPNGHAIKNLFPTDKNGLRPPHLLIFGYNKGAGDIGASSDGTILLSSQLRQEAQQQAEVIYGFNYNHSDILKQAEVYAKINSFWQQVEDRQ